MARRRALLIACDTFDNSFIKLKAPVREAEELGQVLQDKTLGDFEVTLLANESHNRILEAIQKLFEVSAPDDLLLLYLAGHGALDRRRNFYFVATDTTKETLQINGIRETFIHEHMQDCFSRRKILIVDCCYSGTVTKGLFARAGETVDVQRMATKGTVVLAASESFEYAFEKEEGVEARSIFTSRLVEGM